MLVFSFIYPQITQMLADFFLFYLRKSA